jgi:dienelactone hydrolase
LLPTLGRAQSVHFPSLAAGIAPAGPEINGWLYKPEGNGPHPAIVLAHACGGVSDHTDVWGKLLRSWGYVVLAPDSFGPRGERQVCGRGMVVSANMRVADVAGALAFLNRQPFARKNDIGLIGHSHGGWTTVRVVQKVYGLAASGLRAAVAYYPSCQPQYDRDVTVPLLILIGDRDDWTLADNCRKLQAAGFSRPDLVEAVYYPGAFHSFDARTPDRNLVVADGGSHHLGYDATAAPDAEARTKAWFANYLKP